MSYVEPRYQVNKIPNMDLDNDGNPIEGYVWEVLRQNEGPWGTVQVARFSTRSEAREYAREMNSRLGQ